MPILLGEYFISIMYFTFFIFVWKDYTKQAFETKGILAVVQYQISITGTFKIGENCEFVKLFLMMSR